MATRNGRYYLAAVGVLMLALVGLTARLLFAADQKATVNRAPSAETKRFLDGLPQAPASILEAPKATFTSFAQQQLVSTNGGTVYGNWNASFDGACQVTYISSLQKGSIIEIKVLGKCADGKVIIECDHY